MNEKTYVEIELVNEIVSHAKAKYYEKGRRPKPDELERCLSKYLTLKDLNEGFTSFDGKIIQIRKVSYKEVYEKTPYLFYNAFGDEQVLKTDEEGLKEDTSGYKYLLLSSFPPYYLNEEAWRQMNARTAIYRIDVSNCPKDTEFYMNSDYFDGEVVFVRSLPGCCLEKTRNIVTDMDQVLKPYGLYVLGTYKNRIDIKAKRNSIYYDEFYEGSLYRKKVFKPFMEFDSELNAALKTIHEMFWGKGTCNNDFKTDGSQEE